MRLKLVETYACPQCKRKTTYVFGQVVRGTYVCSTQCEKCGYIFMGVDSLQRCEACKKKIECMLKGITVAEVYTKDPSDDEGPYCYD